MSHLVDAVSINIEDALAVALSNRNRHAVWHNYRGRHSVTGERRASRQASTGPFQWLSDLGAAMLDHPTGAGSEVDFWLEFHG